LRSTQPFLKAAPLSARPPCAHVARILIVDDQNLVRKTVRSLLRGHAIEICGEAKDGKEAIDKVKQLKPDLVLLDINMPVLNGVQAAYEIRRVAPSTKIIFFTIHDSPETISAARLIGVDGFVSKAAAGTALIPAVKRILEVEY
jgi:DNA-binding NarL/FixJ family response regulator